MAVSSLKVDIHGPTWPAVMTGPHDDRVSAFSEVWAQLRATEMDVGAFSVTKKLLVAKITGIYD